MEIKNQNLIYLDLILYHHYKSSSGLMLFQVTKTYLWEKQTTQWSDTE